MDAVPELRQEADAFLERLEQIRALKLVAPPRVLEAALRVPPPHAGTSWLSYGLLGALGLAAALYVWPEAGEAPAGGAEPTTAVAPPSPPAESTSENEATTETEVAIKEEATPQEEGVAPIEAPPGAELPPEAARWVPGAERPPATKRSSGSSPKSHARMKIISVGPATPEVPEEVEPQRAPTAPFRYLLVPENPDTVLRSLHGLVTRLGGQFLRTDGSAKAPYPLDPGAKDRVLLKVSAANLSVLVQNLSSVGVVSVIAQPDSVPPSGMVGVYVEVEAP